MTMLQRKACHEACACHIQSYLEWDGSRPRALAKRFINLMPGTEQLDWARAMDDFRVMFGNDKDWNGQKAVTYQHFVISPDPNDDISIDDLMDLAQDWAQEFFGTDLEPGKLGQYQVAIVAHDDGTNGVRHAHVIVNNTDLASTKRLQISNSDNDALWDRLQEMSEERGLSRMDDARTYRKQKAAEDKARKRLISSGRYQTKVERELARSGHHSWKQDLANYVKIARRTSKDLDEFEECLARFGVGIRETINAKGELDLIYSHPSNPTRWQCSGYRLGLSYTREMLMGEMQLDHSRYPARDPHVRERAAAYAMRSFVEGLESAHVQAHGIDLEDLARALHTNDRYGIRCLEDYKRALDSCASRKAAAPNDQSRKRFAKEDKALRHALEVAEHADLFADVPDGGSERFKKERTQFEAKRSSGKRKPNRRRGEPRAQGRTRNDTRAQTQSQDARMR